jgi:cytochrome c-type biogenesis protein CcmH/NrfG
MTAPVAAVFFFEQGFRRLIENQDDPLTPEMAERVIQSATDALDELYSFSNTAGAFGLVLLAQAYMTLGQFELARDCLNEASCVLSDAPFARARVIMMLEEVDAEIRFPWR